MKHITALITGFFLILSLPVVTFGEEVNVEGTIQGLWTAMAGKTCPQGEEEYCSKVESTYVLQAESGKYYFVPTFTYEQVRPYLYMNVRVEGKPILDGKGIEVTRAEVFEGNSWKTVFSPEIRARYIQNKKLLQLTQEMKAILPF